MNWMNLFEPHILNRGMEYYEDGCVSDLQIIGNTVEAEVEGSEYYQVSVELDGGEIMDMFCDCPYAAKGYNCKHMAAVLYKYEEYLADESENEAEVYHKDSMNIVMASTVNTKRQEIERLLTKIPEQDAKELLIDMLSENEGLKNELQLKYDFQMNAIQMTNLKKEIKNIIYRYGGGRFIDWQYAYDFCSDLRNFLDDKIPLMIEKRCYLQAFELTNIVFREVGNTDMDDSDGGSSMVAETCYDYWRKITENCNENDREIIKNWFRDHKNTDFVIDYMEEYVNEFFEQYFMSEDEIWERMNALDEIIELHRKQNDAGTIYSIRYGYRDVLLQRLEYMHRLHMPEQDILKYRLMNRHFFCVRELEISEALENGNKELAVQILEESKQMDTEYPEKIKKYSLQLISLYKESGKEDEYREELIFQLLHCYQSDLSCYNELKACISSEAEWDRLTNLIINASKNIYFTCDVLNQEKRYEQLMQIIERENSVNLLDKYEKQLRKTHSERMLRIYANYIIPEMDHANCRKHYRQLVQYLKKMVKCENGKAEAESIARKWRMEYKRRTALMDELRNAGF
ncbi:MAG: SWIM zinc finger family protein [Lachnospiraceae bacterium]|jgi:hypothetical protein|nr:SWIM zinc finger family protein [Lachnospiraceae bacterium]